MTIVRILSAALFLQAAFCYEVRVSQETAPPGGVAQVKVSLTDPEPILMGNGSMSFDSAVVDDILGIALHSPAGDAVGTATYRNGRLSFRLHSPLASLGMAGEYPFLTIAVSIKSTARIGTELDLTLDLGQSTFLDPFGHVAPLIVKPGSITVGAPFAIHDVLPGGGIIPAGQPVTILGSGFTPDMIAKLEDQSHGVATFVSSTEFRFTNPTDFMLTGVRIEIRQKRLGRQRYFSYLRPATLRTGSVYDDTVPLFSWHAPRQVLLSFPPGDASRSVALQNPHAGAIQVTISLPSVIQSTPVTLTVPGRTRTTRDLAALFPGINNNASVSVVAEQGVSVAGLQGNGTEPATAIAPLTLRAGPF
jgi:hypothetical protein